MNPALDKVYNLVATTTLRLHREAAARGRVIVPGTVSSAPTASPDGSLTLVMTAQTIPGSLVSAMAPPDPFDPREQDLLE